MKGFLSQKGVEFEVRDITEDESAQAELVAMGFTAIPVTVVGDRSEDQHKDFFVDLRPSVGSPQLVNRRARGTILNDKASISICDGTANGGDGNFKFLDVFVPCAINGLNNSRGMEIGSDGNIYVTSEKGPWPGAVLRYDGQSGAFLGVFAAHETLDGAKDLEFGPDGHLYVTNNGTHTVVRFCGACGMFLNVFVPPHSGGLCVPRGLAFGSDGYLYVASGRTNQVLCYEGPCAGSPGQCVREFACVDNPTALTFDTGGNLYVASGAHDRPNTIFRVDPTGCVRNFVCPRDGDGDGEVVDDTALYGKRHHART